MEFKKFDKEKMKEELQNDVYNLVYINYEKKDGIKTFKNEGNALNFLDENDFNDFYKIYIFNSKFMKTIYKFGEDDYRYLEINSEDFDENTKKYREILIKIKENPDEKKVNRLKVLTGENKITKKEMVQFLEFLGGEKDERESN